MSGGLTPEEVLGAFPAPEFRPYQKATVLKIAEYFNSGIKIVVLEAPTGSGKSYVNTTFCRLFRSYYATPQLTLINQIKRDPLIMFDFAEIKGRRNYNCIIEPDVSVDLGLCVRRAEKVCEKLEECPYWVAKKKALKSHSVLTSLAYLIVEGMSGETPVKLDRRELCVLDESHNLADIIVGLFSIELTPFNLPKYLYDFYSPKFGKWEPQDICSSLLAELNQYVSSFESYRLVGEPSLSFTKSYVEAKDLISKIEVYLESYSERPWVQKLYDTSKGRALSIMPVFASSVSAQLWNRAERFIISSATVLDPVNFAEDVGLFRFFKSDEIGFIRVPSYFPPGNRPIIDFSVTDGVKKHKEQWAPQALVNLIDILRAWEGSNVAVHVPSYEDANWIAERLPDDLKSRLIVHTPEDREDAVEEFINSRNKVFLAVAFREGQDWKGDIADAQVLWRVPYPEAKDPRVRYRLAFSPTEWQWYFLKTAREVIQAYGRAIRSEYDSKPFYVLDGSFWRLLRRVKSKLPDWFTEALPVDWEKI